MTATTMIVMTNLYEDEEWKVLSAVYEDRWNEGQSYKNAPSIKFSSKHIGTVVFNSTGSMERYVSVKLAN